jgi:hypothetical protein
MLDPDTFWKDCPDIESVPDRCSGAWVVKNSRVMVQAFSTMPRADARRSSSPRCSSLTLSQSAAFSRAPGLYAHPDREFPLTDTGPASRETVGF